MLQKELDFEVSAVPSCATIRALYVMALCVHWHCAYTLEGCIDHILKVKVLNVTIMWVLTVVDFVFARC